MSPWTGAMIDEDPYLRERLRWRPVVTTAREDLNLVRIQADSDLYRRR